MLTSYLKPHPTVRLFSVSVPFTLRVLTPPPIRHPKTEIQRSSHSIVLPRSNLGSPVQNRFHPTVLHRPSHTCCLAAFNLLPRSLSDPEYPRHEHVSAVSSPIRSSPFCCSCQDSSAPVNPCGLSLLFYVLPPPFLKPLPSPAGLERRPSTFWYQGGLCLLSWSPDLLHCASYSLSPVPHCLLLSSGSSYLCLCALLRVFERPWAPQLPGSFPTPPSSQCCLVFPAPFRLPVPPPSFHFVSSLYHLRQSFLVRGVRAQRRILLSWLGLLG